MPRFYYQCPKCKSPFSTKASLSRGIPEIKCLCVEGKETRMTYRGQGEEGRNNWPHGEPDFIKRMKRATHRLEAEVVIHTDGACEPNPGYGGWGAILQYSKNGEIFEREIAGGALNTTNNRMELTAVLESLKALKRPCHVVVYTDSKYVQQGIGDWKEGNPGQLKGWMVGWKVYGWQRSTGPLLNPDIWIKLDEEVRRHKSLKMKHVKGHNGHPLNERCDILAVNARLTIYEDDRRATP